MSRPGARLMSASILSFVMFTRFAFWRTRRSAGLLSGSGPPALTAMTMSFPMRANCFAIRSHRANMVALRGSKMRPIVVCFLGVRKTGRRTYGAPPRAVHPRFFARPRRCVGEARGGGKGRGVLGEGDRGVGHAGRLAGGLPEVVEEEGRAEGAEGTGEGRARRRLPPPAGDGGAAE